MIICINMYIYIHTYHITRITHVDYTSRVTWKRTWNFLGLLLSPSIDRVVEPHMALVMYWIGQPSNNH